MGNKIGRRRQVVDEKYTRPQGLFRHKDIDQKKLRKLILESKLAPCYPGDDDYAHDLEECPICFLYYPSLNRSRCCMKSICTECFLQMKPANSSQPPQCPFCKTPCYAVEYRGVKTKEEKGIEQVEEQKVIEAQLRMRQQELLDDAEQTKRRQYISSSSRIVTPVETEHDDTFVPIRAHSDLFPSQASCSGPTSTQLHTRENRDGNFDMNLEDISVTEAMWVSMQEQNNQATSVAAGNFLLGPSYSEECYNSRQVTPAEVTFSPGLACAAGALAGRHHMNGETVYPLADNGDTINRFASNAIAFNMLHQVDALPTGNFRFVQNNPTGHWIEIPPDCGREIVREEYDECSNSHWSTQTEASTSYTGSDVLVDASALTVPMLDVGSMGPGNIIQENFEEQMMLTMAVSLAEARAMMNNQGLCWNGI